MVFRKKQAAKNTKGKVLTATSFQFMLVPSIF
jgi:hypothetical protein